MGVDPLRNADITAPRSRHSLHVTAREDLREVAGWSRDTLYGAVTHADSEDRVVVLDYGREALYIADGADLSYHPPRALGLGAPPALGVEDPLLYDPDAPESRRTEPHRSVRVSPEFDVLVPAFDREETEEDPLPPVDSRPTGSASRFGAGSPG